MKRKWLTAATLALVLMLTLVSTAFAGGKAVPASITVNGKEARFDQAPFTHGGSLMLPLRALVEAAGGTIDWQADTQSANVRLADRTATFIVGQSKAEMYLHAARYMQRNFIDMEQSVRLRGSRMFISADAVESVLGMTEVASGDPASLALRFPPSEAAVDLSYNLRWLGNRLEVTGKADIPDLHFELLLDGAVIAQADAMVKEGAYVAYLLVLGGPATGRLDLRISDPVTGRELVTVYSGNQNR